MELKRKTCFVIMGFGKKQDPVTNRTIDLDETYKKIIYPAVARCNYVCIRADEILDSTLIDRSMYALLYQADLVIADISTYNPNAIYELGTRHTLKPYSTIIIKENNVKIPFDLNHIRTLNYEHLGNEISDSEAKRSGAQLACLIKSIETNPKNDSPLYIYIPKCKAPIIEQEDLDEIIGELKSSEKSIFSITEKAKEYMSKSMFIEAAEKWQQLDELVKNDSYYIQQQALCTYKSENPTKLKALTEALQIMTRLKGLTDSETLGITGAINKRLWHETDDISFLNDAIENYKKGWILHNDYYTGENYALCLDMMAIKEKDERHRIHKQVEAEEVRKKIIGMVLPTLADVEPEGLKWKYATLANCYLAINNSDEATKFDEEFKNQKPTEWECNSYKEFREIILNLKNKPNAEN